MDKLSASEALYGFCGWITSRKERVVASETDEAGVWAELVNEFCKANDLSDPKEEWVKNLIHPKPISQEQGGGG